MNTGHTKGTNGVPTRELPHSDDAEECVLSGCLFAEEGAAILEKCVEAGIGPGSFYDSKHGMVFESLLRLRAAKSPIETYSVAEEMQSAGTLEQVGGIPFITQVSSKLPTSATISHLIGKVRGQASLREIIREATRTIEQAYTVSSDVDEFGSEVQQRFHAVAANGSHQSALAEWAHRRAGVGRVIPDDVPTLYLRDTPIYNRSNIGLMTALQKSGKSAGIGAIISAVISGTEHRGDSLGFRGHNPLGHALLHYDTEQSPKDHEALVEIGRRRSGLEKLPDWLHSYGVKGVSAQELRIKMRRMMRELSKLYGGIYMALLDGSAEFVVDTNEPKDCNPFVTDLDALATDYNCSMVCVLHLNPSPGGQNTKSRGHLGSQLERKCETDLRLVKDANGVTTAYTASARHSPILEKDGVRFSWDNASAMHLSLENRQVSVDSDKANRLREVAAEVWAEDKGLRYTEVVARLKKVCRIKDAGAESKFTEMQKFKVISKQAFLWFVVP